MERAQRLSVIHLAYFLGVPLVIAVYAGLNNWEIRHAAGTVGSLAFYAAHAFLPWWITCLSTTLFKHLLATWKPAWPLLLLLGHLLGASLVLPYSNWLIGVYDASFADMSLSHPATAFLSTDFWVYLLRAGVIWFGVNFLFDRFLGLPLYRYEIPRGYENGHASDSASSIEPDSAAWPGMTPAFVARLPQALTPDDLIAIKAEQHYIKIFGKQKNHMVLYRFSDAINELSPELGKQVHRSFWVNTAAIENVHARAKDFYLLMRNGEKIPVSGPYQGMVRDLARSNNIEIKS